MNESKETWKSSQAEGCGCARAQGKLDHESTRVSSDFQIPNGGIFCGKVLGRGVKGCGFCEKED